MPDLITYTALAVHAEVLVGMEGLAAVCGDATARTLADACTYTAEISACGISWMA